MKLKKRYLFLAACLLAGASIGPAYAFWTKEDTAEATFSVYEIKADVQPQWNASQYDESPLGSCTTFPEGTTGEYVYPGFGYYYLKIRNRTGVTLNWTCSVQLAEGNTYITLNNSTDGKVSLNGYVMGNGVSSKPDKFGDGTDNGSVEGWIEKQDGLVGPFDLVEGSVTLKVSGDNPKLTYFTKNVPVVWKGMSSK